ncbi:MAG: adenylyltransferase/cytidyltransferase family protein [Patescibacteria group bacterium]
MVIEFKDLALVRKKHKNQRIILAGGVFDILHLGHVKYFNDLKKMGDILVIAVSSDKRVRERKGKERPILTQTARVRLVAELKSVDYALIAPGMKKDEVVPTTQVIKTLKPDVFVTPDKRWIEYKNTVAPYGVKLKIVKIKKINSTTNIIQRVLKTYGILYKP